MKEEIEKVLSNETYTTNEERVDAIASALGTLVIPKERYNDLNAKLRTVESNLSALSTEYDDFKKSKMTEDEKKAAEIEEYNNKLQTLSLKESEYAVRDLFTEANISKEKYEKILDKVVSTDKSKSVEIAQTFIDLLKETTDETRKQTTTDLLNGTPKPVGGTDSSNSVSRLQALQNELDEAIKNKDAIAQTRLTTAIFNEQSKQAQI